MELIFMVQTDKFVNDVTKTIYIISHLYRISMNWAATFTEKIKILLFLIIINLLFDKNRFLEVTILLLLTIKN